MTTSYFWCLCGTQSKKDTSFPLLRNEEGYERYGVGVSITYIHIYRGQHTHTQKQTRRESNQSHREYTKEEGRKDVKLIDG